jgi:DNA mismatch endonuclease, patch repair protein
MTDADDPLRIESATMSDRPPASSEDVRRRMRSTRRRDTPAEVALRRELYARGLRYRVDRPLGGGLRRRGDVVFVGARTAVFVDGCFWHGCPLHGSWPRTNAKWWRDKIRANIARDRDTNQKLDAAGWLVIRVWEHEDVQTAALRISEAVARRRAE